MLLEMNIEGHVFDLQELGEQSPATRDALGC